MQIYVFNGYIWYRVCGAPPCKCVLLCVLCKVMLMSTYYVAIITSFFIYESDYINIYIYI